MDKTVLLFMIMGLCLGLAFLVWFLVERVKGVSVKALILKSLTSACFMMLAVTAYMDSVADTQAPFGFFVIIGLLFGLFGDIWLDLKWVYPDDNDIYTYTGFCVFAFQHILLIVGMLLFFADFSCTKGILFAILPIVVGMAAGVLNVLFMEKPMKLNYGKFKAITGFYGGILISMTLLSGCLAFYYGFDNMVVDHMFFGAVPFLISDLILSGTYFGEGKNRPIDVITNHATYYIGQFIIASSLLFLA